MSFPLTSSVSNDPVLGSSSICFLSRFRASEFFHASRSACAAELSLVGSPSTLGTGLDERGLDGVLRTYGAWSVWRAVTELALSNARAPDGAMGECGASTGSEVVSDATGKSRIMIATATAPSGLIRFRRMEMCLRPEERTPWAGDDEGLVGN